MAKTALVEVARRAPNDFNKFVKMRMTELKEEYPNHRERLSAAAMEWKMLSGDEKVEMLKKVAAYIETLDEAPKAPRKKRVPLEKVEEDAKKATKTTRGPSIYNLYVSKLMNDTDMMTEVPNHKERFSAVVKKYSELTEEAKKALAEEFKDALKKPEKPTEPKSPVEVSAPDAPKKRGRKPKTPVAPEPAAAPEDEPTDMQMSDSDGTDVVPVPFTQVETSPEPEPAAPKKKRGPKAKAANA